MDSFYMIEQNKRKENLNYKDSIKSDMKQKTASLMIHETMVKSLKI